MKHWRKFLVGLCTALCVVAGVVGLAACADDTAEIGPQYKAVYEQYKSAVGEEAKSLEDWYAELSAGIKNVNQGEVSDVEVVTVNDSQFIKLEFANGKLFMTSLITGGVV